MKGKITFLAAFVLFGVASAVAQESTGSLVGTVSDVSGAAVPRAALEVSSPALGRTLHSTTDQNGSYVLPNLPPGVYTATASAKGFAGAKVENINLLVGKQLKVNFKLEIAKVEQAVVVTGEAPLVDTQSSKAAVNISRREIDSIPKPRSFQNLAALAPGAQLENKSGGLQVDGASGAENIWLIDGVDTTHVAGGFSSKNLLVDWVQELQVKSSGFEAEYGGALGGVVHVITKSGGNDLHGEVRYYYYGTALQTDPRPRLRINPADNKTAEYLRDPKDNQTVNEMGFQLGGPVVKDRLWYFLAYEPILDHSSRNVFFVVPKVTRSFQNQQSTQHWTGKLTFQPWDRLRTSFNVISGRSKTLGTLPSYDGTGNPDSGFERQGFRAPNVTYGADAYLSATSKLFFNFRLGYSFSDFHNVGVPKQVRYVFFGNPVKYFGQLPPEFRQQSGWSNITSNFGTAHDTYTRLTGNADGSWFTRFHGSHNFKFGYQAHRLGNDVFSGFLDDFIGVGFDETWTNVTVPGVTRGTYGYYYKEFVGSKGKVNSYNHGLYVQDSWQVSRRLTLNVGLRDEQETVPSFRTDNGIKSTAIQFPFSAKLAPRLGFAYDLRGDGKSKLYLSFGLYYDLMKYRLSRGSFGGDVDFADVYTLDTLNIGSIGRGNYPGQKGETVDYRIPANAIHPELGGINLIDPRLKPMRTREYTVGYERALGRQWMISARYTRKRLDRGIEDTGVLVPEVGWTFFIANPGEGITRRMYGPGCDPNLGSVDCAGFPAVPKPTRKYDGLELRAQGRWAKNWQSVLSYTFSRLYGNYSGLVSSDESLRGFGRTAPNFTDYYDLPYVYVDASGRYIDGPLATDRTHTLKYYGFYRIPMGRHGLNIGGIFTAGSGIPTTRLVAVTSINTLIENRNSDGRRGAFSLTNLYLAQDFKLSERATLRVDFNLENAFDQASPLNYWPVYTRNPIVAGIPGSPIQRNVDATRGYDYKKQIELQANFNRPASCGSFAADPYCPSARMRLDPQFLKANVFRGPFTGRFGLRFTF